MHSPPPHIAARQTNGTHAAEQPQRRPVLTASSGAITMSRRGPTRATTAAGRPRSPLPDILPNPVAAQPAAPAPSMQHLLQQQQQLWSQCIGLMQQQPMLFQSAAHAGSPMHFPPPQQQPQQPLHYPPPAAPMQPFPIYAAWPGSLGATGPPSSLSLPSIPALPPQQPPQQYFNSPQSARLTLHSPLSARSQHFVPAAPPGMHFVGSPLPHRYAQPRSQRIKSPAGLSQPGFAPAAGALILPPARQADAQFSFNHSTAAQSAPQSATAPVALVRSESDPVVAIVTAHQSRRSSTRSSPSTDQSVLAHQRSDDVAPRQPVASSASDSPPNADVDVEVRVGRHRKRLSIDTDSAALDAPLTSPLQPLLSPSSAAAASESTAASAAATTPSTLSRWTSTPSYRSRPELTTSPSVRFLAGLEDASSDEDEQQDRTAAIAEEGRGDEDWDALPSLLGADLATNFVLSMGAGGAPDIAPLAAQRGEGCFAQSRLLCFGCDADQSERVLRAFQEADDAASCLVSMLLVERKPAHAVLLHSIPAAFPFRAEAEQKMQAFVSFLSDLSGSARTTEQIAKQLTMLDAASSASAPDAAVGSPRSRSRTRSRSGSAAATTRALSSPLSVLSRPRYKAQALEIVERLRDWGVRASLAPWTESMDSVRPTTSEPQQQQQQHPATLFSIHLRLSSEDVSVTTAAPGASSSGSSSGSGTTDSLIKLVRQWLDPSPMPCLDYLLRDVGEWREGACMRRLFAPPPSAEPPTPLSPASAASVSLVTPRAPRAPVESANLDVLPLSPIADDGEQDALDREMERIQRWTGSAPQQQRPRSDGGEEEEEEEKKQSTMLAAQSSESSALALQVASLQSQLAERARAEEATESERLALLKRLHEAEAAQAKLVRDHLALQEQIKSQQAGQPLSKSAQLKADRALAASLHRSLNGSALMEDTARRNMEKQRGLRALETGGNGAPAAGAGKGGKKLTQKEADAAEAAAQAASGLSNPHFDASAAPLAPVFDDESKRAESAAAEARALEVQRARESKERAEQRQPSEGMLLKRSELFTMNHTEMRQLVSGLKEKHGVIGTSNASNPSASNNGGATAALAAPVAVAAAADPVELPPSSDEKIVADPALTIVEMKRAQSTQHWNAAHLPHMLADVKRSALVPASRTEWAEAEKARAKAELAKLKEGADGDEGADAAEEKSSAPNAGGAQDASTSSGSRRGGAPQLIAYSSGKLYDKLTGVPVEDLEGMSTSERLRRAEERVEEVEMDDMYRRFLQPRTSELGGAAAALSARAGKSPERDAQRRRKEKGKQRRASAHAIPGHAALVSPSALNKLPAAAATASAKEATSRRRSMASGSFTATVSASAAAGAGTINLLADAPVNSAALLSSSSKPDHRSSSDSSSSDGLYWVDLLASASELTNPFLLGSPDPYLEVYRRRQYIWELVATSETAPRTLDANWGSILCSVDALCNMQLDRKILFKVWTANRMQGRTLLGELCISLTQIQENVGSRFKLTLPAGKHEAEAQGTRVSGTLRFHHAELCVNSTKPNLIFRGLNVKDPLHPVFAKLSSCLVRLQLAVEALPLLGRFAIFKEKPDPYLELFRSLPDGRWDTSVLQYHEAATRNSTLANASASGSVGGCLWRSEPAFKTTRPKYPVFVVPLWALCFGDVNRPLRVRVRHKDQTLAWVDLTLKEMCLAHQAGKKVPLKAMEPSPAPATATAPTTAVANTTNNASGATTAEVEAKQAPQPQPQQPPQRSAGFLLLRHVSIYSHLSELPVLCANAGIERKPVAGISNLPLRQLIRQQVRSSLGGGAVDAAEKPGMDRATSRVQSQRSSVDSLGSVTTAVASLDAEEKAAAERDAAADSGANDLDAALSSSRDVRRNVYRGLHHIRNQCAGKFFTSMAPVKARVLEARQMALLMGSHERLGADSVLGRHFLRSPIFDPHLIPFIFTFLGAEMPMAPAPTATNSGEAATAATTAATVSAIASSKSPPAAASSSLPLSPQTTRT